MSFDAGSIESRLDLDRTPFQRGLQEADREAREFSAKRIAPVIDIDTARAKTDLDDIDERLKTTGRQRPRPKVSPETEGAQEVLAKLRAELLALGAETTRVKTDVDDEKSRVKILGLEAQLARLGARVAQPRISVAGAAEAEFQIARIKAQLDGLGGDRATPSVRVGGGDGNSGKGFLQGGVSGPSTLITAAAAGIPTLVPVVATLTAGLGALTSMFTAAGIGAAGFALLAKPQLEAVSEAQKKLTTAQDAYNKATTDKGRANALRDEYLIYAQLTPQQREYMTQLAGLKGVYQQLQASVSTPVFSVAASVMHALGTAGMLLKPVFQAAGDTFVELGQQFDTWVSKSAGVRSFVDFLTRETGPALYALVHSLGNVARGFGGILMAFEPLLGPLEHGMQSFTEKFAAWGAGLGTSAGFQKFLDYVRTNGPAVGRTFSELAKAVGTIVTQLAPFGPIGLQVVTMLARLINQNPELVKVAASLILVWKGVSLLSGAAGGITQTVTSFGKFAALFQEGGMLAGAAPMLGTIAVAAGPVIIALAGLAIGGYELYTHWHQIIGFIERDWKNLLLLIPVLGPVMSLVAHNWNTIWDGMKDTVTTAARIILDGIKGVVDGVLSGLDGLLRAAGHLPGRFGKPFRDAAKDVEGFKRDVDGTLEGAIQSFGDKGGAAGQAAGQQMSIHLGAQKAAVVAAANTIVSNAANVLNGFAFFGGTAGSSGGSSFAGGVRGQAGNARGAGQTLGGGFLSGLPTDASSWGARVGGSFAAGIRAALPQIEGAAAAAAAQVTAFLQAFSPTKKGPLSAAQSGGPNAMGANLILKYAQGMRASIPHIIGAANDVAAAASFGVGTLSGGGMVQRSGSAAPIGGKSVVQNNYLSYVGPSPAQVLNESMRRLDFAVGG